MIDIIVAGDFSPLNRVEDGISRGDYSFLNVEEINRGNAFLIINFETVIATSNNNKINKVGPHLKCSNKVVDYLKYLGVTAVTMANNHTLDYGEDDLNSTIKFLHQSGIKTVGIGKNSQEACEPLYLQQGEETLAIINCCEHEFSYAENEKAGTNPLNPIKQFYNIQEAKTKANYVIVIVHGGHEFFNLPSIRMQETYRFFIDAGADAVINHHQHCFSGFEYWHGKPIYYGLGNFVFDWPGRLPSFYKGYCVKLHLGNTISSEELPYIQCLDEPVVKFGEFEGFRDELESLNKIILDPKRLEIETDKYYTTLQNSCEGVLTPFSNDYLKELVRRGLLPKFFSKKKILLWKAYIDCESHRDVMLHYLKKEI